MSGIVIRHHAADAARPGRVLLVMLPGVGMDAHDFADHGLVSAVHERGLAVDIVATRPDLELYLDGDVATALHRAVMEPALAQGYTRLWLLGISLGSMGALLYASRYAAHVEGLVLLAPFLGTQGLVAEIAEAGGLTQWSAAHSTATALERTMLTWLQDFLARRPARPLLYLGCGDSDRFARGHRLLKDLLPEARVVSNGGQHNWRSWMDLWRQVLDLSPFAETAAP